MRETSRQLLALPLALAVYFIPGDFLVLVMAVWDVYATTYLILTWLAYRNRTLPELHALAMASKLPGIFRFLTFRPAQLSQGAAFLAFGVTIAAMPQADQSGTGTLVIALSVVAVLTSWLVLQVGFVTHYLALHAKYGGLDFPGDEEPAAADFAYFAFSVGTTFGTTDVTVTGRRIRRQVLVHGVLAFLFNTLIVAVAITFVTAYVSGS
ncbi:DUF1345 domain-containing protein [Nonomuraea typhae]|uniref:DUF1345 domain-containing protein n=1 Tax=Nonomuraea typhae TaxID=2603600 RepID=UPI0012FC5C45|nr:DUF1345 domain-containing protein [Nonomuraea typhae]